MSESLGLISETIAYPLKIASKFKMGDFWHISPILNFDVIFRGYAIVSEMSLWDSDMLQTLNFHILDRKWQFGGTIPPKLGLQ